LKQQLISPKPRLKQPGWRDCVWYNSNQEKEMASPAQILANRENARRSSGPKTDTGKQSSSRNATRHGLTSTQIVIPGEAQSAYEELLRGMHQSYAPVNAAERVLVDQIAANVWRLMRAQGVETAFFAKLTEGAEDPGVALAEAFLEKPKEMARIYRYVASAQSAYYKAIAQLSKLQKERASIEESTLESLPYLSSDNAIGFVSYSDSLAPFSGSIAGGKRTVSPTQCP
jgi:hypothetical protein